MVHSYWLQNEWDFYRDAGSKTKTSTTKHFKKNYYFRHMQWDLIGEQSYGSFLTSNITVVQV